MEPSTHALSGAVMACALPQRFRRWWFPVWAAAAAASPDLDVLFVHTPLQYIEYHRGITHSLLGGLALALLLALPLVLLAKRKADAPPAPVSWSLPAVWGFGYLLILQHIWLDCMNSYGTQVFLPFSDYRVRWNALFIVDPMLLLPLLAGILFFRKRRSVMIGLLLWTFLYPTGALGVRLALENHLRTSRLTPEVFTQHLPAQEAIPARPGPGRQDDVQGVHLVPDAFTPFHWKLILDRGTMWDTAGYTVFTTAPDVFLSYAKPPRTLWKELGEKDRMFRVYQHFAVYPALDRVLPQNGTGAFPSPSLEMPGLDEYVFSDLRFGSTIPFVDAIQTRRDGQQINFRIMARILPDGEIDSVRFVTTTGAGGDSGWVPPSP